MSSPRCLEEAHCWTISGVRSAEPFFRAIGLLVPDATHMCLEGAPEPDIIALLSAHVEETPYRAPAGTIWSWPRSKRFTVRASAGLFLSLSDAAPHHAEPEICSHVHFYQGDEPLVQWFDAFDDPMLISKTVPRERVELFCSRAGGVLSDDAASSGA